mgnify:CR=1 FL=1
MSAYGEVGMSAVTAHLSRVARRASHRCPQGQQPDAARLARIQLSNGRPAYSSGKDTASPRRAADISAQAAMFSGNPQAAEIATSGNLIIGARATIDGQPLVLCGQLIVVEGGAMVGT